MKKIIVKASVMSFLFCFYALGDEEYAKVLEMAEHGDIKAQYRISIWYLQGTGVEKDIRKSVEWYKKALVQDANLDTKETRNILQSIKDAAKQGDAEAQFSLGVCNEHGAGYYAEAETIVYHANGIDFAYEPNITMAETWYEKSAEQGYAPAQYIVGMRHSYNTKYSEAIELFKKSAEQGYVLAQNKLADYYLIGMGVEKDEVKAIQWYTKAAEQGDKIARRQLEHLKKNKEEDENKTTEEEKH